MRWSVAILALIVGCGGSMESNSGGDSERSAIADGESGAAASPETASGADEDPCQARNPVLLASMVLSHPTGKPEQMASNFEMPSAAEVCVRRSVTATGKRFASSAYVELDGIRMWNPDDFQRRNQDAEQRVALGEGSHELGGEQRGQKGVVVTISVVAAGPWLSGANRLTGSAGDDVVLTGGSLRGALVASSGSVAVPVKSIAEDGSTVTVSIPAGLPIGPISVTNEWGTATSPVPFVPQDLTTVVRIFPSRTVNDSQGDGTDDITTVQMIDDGRRVALIVTSSSASGGSTTLSVRKLEAALPTNITAIDGQAVSTPEYGGARVGKQSVFTLGFDYLDIRNAETYGAFDFEVRTNGAAEDRYPNQRPVRIVPVIVPTKLMFKTSSTPAAFAAALGGKLLSPSTSSDSIHLMEIAQGKTLEAALTEALARPDHQGVFPESIMRLQYTPTGLSPGQGCVGSGRALDLVADTANSVPGNGGDDAGSYPIPQFTMHETRAVEAWQFSRGAGVKIVVIDSGARATHDDIAPNLVSAWNGLIFTDGSTRDDVDPAPDGSGHGTKVASIAAGMDGNGGMAGVAPDAKIISIRIYNKHDFSEAFAFRQALRFAMHLQSQDPEVKVVNVSGADAIEWEARAAAIVAFIATKSPATAALAYGVLIEAYSTADEVASKLTLVASVGNSNDDWYGFAGATYPADVGGAIAVGSVNASRVVDDYSTRDAVVALVAPVGSIGPVAASRAGDSALVCAGAGTSFSAPQVSGAAAILYGIDPTLSPAQVKAALLNTAIDIRQVDPKNTGDAVGRGLLDVLGAAASIAGRISSGAAWDTVIGPTAGAPPRDSAYGTANARFFLSSNGRSVLSANAAGVFTAVGIPDPTGTLPWDFVTGAGVSDGTGAILLGGSFVNSVFGVFTVDSGAFVGGFSGLGGTPVDEPQPVGGVPGRFLVPLSNGTIASVTVRSSTDVSVKILSAHQGMTRLAVEPGTNATSPRALLFATATPNFNDSTVTDFHLASALYDPATDSLSQLVPRAFKISGSPTSMAISNRTLAPGTKIAGCTAGGAPAILGTFGIGLGFKGALLVKNGVTSSCVGAAVTSVDLGLDVIEVLNPVVPGPVFGHIDSDGSVVRIDPVLGVATDRRFPPKTLSLKRPTLSPDGTRILFVGTNAIINPSDPNKPALYFSSELTGL